ncbi:MAG: hypothetical protein AB7U61_17745 [Methylocystis sp.]
MTGCVRPLANPPPLAREREKFPRYAAIALTSTVSVPSPASETTQARDKEEAMTLPRITRIAARRYGFFTAMLERFRP